MHKLPSNTFELKDRLLKCLTVSPVRPMLICAGVCAVISVVLFYVPKLLIVIFAVLSLLLVAAFCKFRLAIVPIILIFLMLISSVIAIMDITKTNSAEGQTLSVDVTVTETPEKTKYGYSAIVKTASGSALPGGIKMLLFYSDHQLETGGRYNITVKPRQLGDYRTYYYSEGIYACGNLKGEPKRIGTNLLLKAIDGVRGYIKNTLYKNISSAEASTLNALTVGERSGFSEEYSLAVRRAGVSHVMVVSGMHLAIVMNAVFFCTDRLANNRFIRAAIASTVVLAICALCGFTVSVMRAGITYFLMALAPLFKRESDPLNTLSFAAVLMLINSPFVIFSVSFQLSVMSTFGILVISPMLVNAVKLKLSRVNFATELLIPIIITLSATLLTLPITVWYFGEISLISPVSNLLISFAVTAALICAMAALIINLLPVVSGLTALLFPAADALTQYINNVIISLGGNESVVLKVDRAWAFAIALADICIICLITYRRNRAYCKELIKILSKEKKDGNII